ncbi:MAG: PPC domain-containing protein [Deltaproteobacteria bacterium]|nr:PPC domain-containing protein [Deltaproteobacteria bacterium]
MTQRLGICALTICTLTVACGEGGETQLVDENRIAPLGKEDNFFSNVAQEYRVTADVPFRLAESYADLTQDERDERARKLMQGRTQQIAWFLHIYLIDKSHDDDAADYGGMRAMVLDGSFDSEGLKADPDDPLNYAYTFAIEIGGAKDLLALIRKDNELPADADSFELKMAKLENDRLLRFSHSPYRAGEWSPDLCECEVENLPITITPIEPSIDAYLDYSGMFVDGEMDVSVHFGWDYHARYDIFHARALYEWLVEEMGFTSPVQAFTEYNRLSGPLTREVVINGETKLAKVTIYHPDPCEDWDEAGPWGSWADKVAEDETYKKRSCPDYAWPNAEANANPTTSTGGGHLASDLRESMKTRDAVIFSGHSGYTYGYALASWYKTSAGDVDPPEIAKMELPTDRSQLFVISGCDTYHVGQAFKENTSKPNLVNADVITTTSFSNSADVGDVKDILRALVGTEGAKLMAYSYSRLFGRLNPRTWLPSSKFSFYTMYGVHGIDDNPQLNPFADVSKSCDACEQDADCGAEGNICVRLNEREKVCATECLHDSACGEEQVCRNFGSSQSYALKGMACVPRSLSCTADPIEEPEEQRFTESGQLQRGEEVRFELHIGAGARNVEVKLTGEGDADLYTELGQEPTLQHFSCRPYKSTSDETCRYKTVTAETLQVLVRGFSRESSFSLEVTWE